MTNWRWFLSVPAVPFLISDPLEVRVLARVLASAKVEGEVEDRGGHDALLPLNEVSGGAGTAATGIPIGDVQFLETSFTEAEGRDKVPLPDHNIHYIMKSCFPNVMMKWMDGIMM